MDRLLNGLIDASIRQRVVVLLAAVALLIAGVWSASHAATDVLPDFTPPRVVVQAEAPGMGTSDVEELVTRPIERALLGAPQATSVRSSSSPGLAVIALLFEDGVDLFRARQLVAEHVALARGRLPAGVSEPQIAPISAPIGALLKFCLTSTAPDAPQAARDLRVFADWTLRPRILGIPGVAQVTVHGGSVERVEVRADPARMRQRGIALADLTAAVRGSQAALGAGFIDVGGARIDVQNQSRFALGSATEALTDLALPTRDGTPGRLGDVALVTRGDEPPVGGARYDGHPAVYVQVNKLPWADTLTVTVAVERALGELGPALPPGARINPPVFRQATFITTSVGSVGRAMGLGSLLVIAVLVVFLRSGRLAVISLVSIPISILAAVTVLVGTGASINGMTLGGLALAVGEVVDDAIVDVENVWRRLRENARLDAPRAALDVIRDASREVRGSVVYATVIVCLVLVPVLLLSGVAGRIFAPLAQAYILAIAASLAVALTVTPAMCAWLLPRVATRDASPTRLAVRLLAGYRRVLARVVDRPRVVFALAGLLAALAAAALPLLGGRFLPDFHEGALIANIDAAPGTSLDETLRLADRASGELRPAVAQHVAARAGRAELDDDSAPVHHVEMDVLLPPDTGDWETVTGTVAVRFARVPGISTSVEGFLTERVHEILAGDTSPIVVQVLGEDLATLRGLAADVARTLAGTPGIGDLRVESQIDVPQLLVRPDRAALARYGVRPLDLAEAIATWRQGSRATQLLAANGRTVDVVVTGAPSQRGWEALADLPIDTHGGVTVPVSALASIVRVPAPASINHEQGERRINLGATARGASVSDAVARFRTRLRAEVHVPPGYRVEVGGEAVARSAAAIRLALVGGVVLLGIFALLAVAFGALRDAVVVMVNFPLGLVGGVVAATLSPDGLSVAGFVGFITLFGIIARNGIMLVAHTRHIEAAHPAEDPVARVLRAAEERLLPIVMTALTAGLGLLPLALSLGSAGSELESPMAIIVCGGLVTSTTLNMLVLPTVYVWLARRRVARATG